MRGICVAVLLASGSALTIAQTADSPQQAPQTVQGDTSTAPKPAFVVASVKPSQAGGGFLQIGFRAGGFLAEISP